jgi:malate dehydrogenase (oxaloacetate-decarboxylating)
MSSHQDLEAKAAKPQKEALRLHPFYRGKIQIMPRCRIRDVDDFAIWYSPGVAEACRDIVKYPERVYTHTSKWNTIAVVTDGTRVLGLGNIGPEAGLPVMEGKCLLYKYLGGVDAVPICLDTRDAEAFIKTVKMIQPAFGGINLEDIEQPKCFHILDTLRAEMKIPVWHDDQQGTATVTLAGLINALKVVGKKMGNVKMAMIGSGAANVAICRMLVAAGADPKKMIVVDSKGILHPGRKDLEEHKEEFRDKWHLCNTTNAEHRTGGISDAMKDAEVCIALSRSGPGVIKKEWVASMAKNAILFPCANPVPEIWPWDAKEAGARVVATGRSDFPNQVNNSMGFPAIFRGALDVGASTITDEMCIAAAYELAACAEEKGLHEENIIPTMAEVEPFIREAVAVGMKAQEQGIAKIKLSKQELRKKAESMIKEARRAVDILQREQIIPEAPEK